MSRAIRMVNDKISSSQIEFSMVLDDVDETLYGFLAGACHERYERKLDGLRLWYIHRVYEKLVRVGIKMLQDLISPLLERRHGLTLNSKLSEAGEKCFTSETLLAMREGLICQPVALKGFLRWARPNWRRTDCDTVRVRLNEIGVHNLQSLHSVLVTNSLNKQLKRYGLKCLTSESLETLKQRSSMVVAFDQDWFDVGVHLLSGRLLVSLPVHGHLCGTDLRERILPHLEEGQLIQDVLVDGVHIRHDHYLGDLNLGKGDAVQLVLRAGEVKVEPSEEEKEEISRLITMHYMNEFIDYDAGPH